jgi:hypothetical protein
MKLLWTENITSLDLHHIIPIFFSGLAETSDPYQFSATEGLFQLLETCTVEKFLPVVPELVQSIKDCLNTKKPQVITSVLRAIQQMVAVGPGIVKELSKGYNKFLPVFNILRVKRGKGSTGTAIANLVDETLEVLEMGGGKNAFRVLRKMIPNYTSCMQYSE